jgi:hypothetical protein
VTGDAGIRVDRRTTIKWLAATMAASYAGCSGDEKYLGEEIPGGRSPGALLGKAAIPATAGYGIDPDLVNPSVPWPLTMTDAQLDTASALCDVILPADDRSPAASALGVPDFIDEWVSAPYPQQQGDRELILNGLEWLERRSRERLDTAFAAADDRQRAALVDEIAGKAANAPQPGQDTFFRRFRYLTVGAFYTTEAGIADVGYIGNVAISGEYPGPSDEAMVHLAGVLKQLGLSLPG